MRIPASRRLIPGFVLVCALLGALALRVWGIGFGLPAYTRYHPDEHALVDRAAAILYTGDWNLHRFNYPPFYAYLQAMAYAVLFLKLAAEGVWSQVPPFTVPDYYEWGRLLTALVGTATVLVVYLAGRGLQTRRAAVLSAVLLASSYLHVIHSHYATFDVMVGFLAILTLLFSDLLRSEQRAMWYLLAGLSAGLAGATKYNGAVVVVVPLVAHILVTPWDEWGWINGRLFLIPAGFLLGFFGGNPFALGNLTGFLNGLALVLHHYGTAQPGFEGTGNWRWYAKAFFTSADALWVATGVLGLAAQLWRDWKKGLLLAIFPAVYFVMVSRFVVRFERNMVPILPFLALGGGWLLDAAAGWLARRMGRGTAASGILAAGGAILVIAIPLAAGLSFDMALSGTDHRELAGRWVEESIEPGSKIAIEHYAIPFDYDSYHVEDVLRVSNHELDWYQEEEFDFLVISDGLWPVLQQAPGSYAAMLQVYDSLTSDETLLKEFVPNPPALVVAGYPTVGVYHFAPVRIHRVPKAGR